MPHGSAATIPPPIAEAAEQQQHILLYYKYVELAPWRCSSSSGEQDDGGASPLQPGSDASAAAAAATDQRAQVQQFYETTCATLRLRGRVRVAYDGVNATLGGSLAALRTHMQQLTKHPLIRGGDIDFKLAPSSGPASAAASQETKFDGLQVPCCYCRL